MTADGVDPDDLATTLRTLTSGLRRQWKLIAAVTLGMALLALAYVLTATPQYTARAALVVDPRISNSVNGPEAPTLLLSDALVVDSEIKVLGSRDVTWRVAKALGLPPDQINALAGCCGRWSEHIPDDSRLREAGFDPDNPVLRRVLVLTDALIGFPRHLSQHPGGFVISEQPLDTLVPIENASMADRTVTVKGLAEMDVKSDFAVWTLGFRRGGDRFAEVQQGLSEDRQRVLDFLRDPR